MSADDVKRGDVVSIEWVDSISAHGWGIPSTSPLNHHSVGKVWELADDRVIITTSITPSGKECLSPLHIPTEAIMSMVIVELD